MFSFLKLLIIFNFVNVLFNENLLTFQNTVSLNFVSFSVYFADIIEFSKIKST